MVRTSLVAVVLLAVAAPLIAQDEVVWSSKRPDAHAPLGLTAGRTLDQGEIELRYRFERMSFQGVWLDTDSLPTAVVLESYAVAPLSLENSTHHVGAAYGATTDLTLLAGMSFSQRQREQLEGVSGDLYITEINQPGDLEISGLYKVFDQDGTRAHVHAGALIPVGAFDITSQEPLPYDMRPGAGTVAVLPGATATAQNEFGTVGAQLQGAFYLGTNSSGYAPGDRLDGSAWAAYRINDYLSFSARTRYQSWQRVDGQDDSLDPTRDPGNDAFYLGGRRVDVLTGVNFLLPEDSSLSGHRVALEWIFPVHQRYDGPQLGADWGITLGWQASF
jgi:hypothetical protein